MRECLLRMAHDGALRELRSGLQLGLPNFGLIAFGSIIAL
jgi:hypothetical protein